MEFMIDCRNSTSSQRILGTGAPFRSDVNLIAQRAMGSELIAGVFLAKKKRYRAHGACQTTLGMIGFEMWPSFRLQIAPHIHRLFHGNYCRIAAIHAALGTAAELLGIYIALVAGTALVPPSLRFTRWRR